MPTLTVTYHCRTNDNRVSTIEARLHRKSLDLIPESQATLPFWTEMSYHRCSNCLLAADHPHCPAAISIMPLLDSCRDLISHQELEVEVVTPERTVSTKTTAQRGISSLMGLLLATSGCPHTAFLKPMARFHLPFASEEETIYRASSMYLLGQYFVAKKTGRGDFQLSGLKQKYTELRKINRGLGDRLQSATEHDSSLNALVLLDLLARTVPYAIEDSLDDIQHLFSAYLVPG